MNGSSPPKPIPSAQPVCEPAVRRWALISITAGIVVAWGGGLSFFTGHGEGLVGLLFLVGTLAVIATHIQLYRAVRDDIVMAPEANSRFLHLLRWYGPAATIELLLFIHSGRQRR